MAIRHSRTRRKRKEPSLRAEARHTHKLFRVWAFSEADPEGRWAWKHIAEGDLRKVIEKLAKFEKMSQNEINKSHFIRIEKFFHQKDGACHEAQKRIRKIKGSRLFDEIDGIFSFRINGKKRLWCLPETGLAQNQILYKILWWDPEHDVWPTKQNRR